MKKAVFLIVFLIIMSNIATAKTIEEDVMDDKSIEVPGYNITILTIGTNKKSFVACINNEKYIINRNSKKELENLKIEPLKIYEDYIRLKITYSCESCICDESCSNILCFNQEQGETIEEIINENDKESNNIEKKEDIKSASILLFLIVVILLVLLVIKRKRGR